MFPLPRAFVHSTARRYYMHMGVVLPVSSMRLQYHYVSAPDLLPTDSTKKITQTPSHILSTLNSYNSSPLPDFPAHIPYTNILYIPSLPHSHNLTSSLPALRNALPCTSDTPS